eukprot:scaffold803_cov310-Pinguiococcus_pyrenoidosus.AAC.163
MANFLVGVLAPSAARVEAGGNENSEKGRRRAGEKPRAPAPKPGRIGSPQRRRNRSAWRGVHRLHGFTASRFKSSSCMASEMLFGQPRARSSSSRSSFLTAAASALRRCLRPDERREKSDAQAPAIDCSQCSVRRALRRRRSALWDHARRAARREALLRQVGNRALHAPRRPLRRLRRPPAVQLDGTAKVGDDGGAIRLHEDVLRLDVEVEPALRVAVAERLGDVDGDIHGAELGDDHGGHRVTGPCVHGVQVEFRAPGEEGVGRGLPLQRQRSRSQDLGMPGFREEALEALEGLPVLWSKHLEREVAGHLAPLAPQRLHHVHVRLQAASDASLDAEAAIRGRAAHVHGGDLRDHDSKGATGHLGVGFSTESF